MASPNMQDEIYLAKAENKPLVAAHLDDAPFSDDVALILTKAQHVDARSGSTDEFVRSIPALPNAAAWVRREQNFPAARIRSGLGAPPSASRWYAPAAPATGQRQETHRCVLFFDIN